MSQSKHTPGPWEVMRDHPQTTDIVYIRPSGHSHPEGEITILFGPIDDEQRANAALIAAAPDLLAALIRLVQAHCGHSALVTDPEEAWDKAEAAIAEAEVK